MAFDEIINREMVLAAKSKDKIRLSAIRMIKTGIHNREIDLKRKMTESEFLQMLSSMVKQRKDSIDQFQKGGREDLVEKEGAELKVIQEFMPAQMSEEDIDLEIQRTIQEVGAASIKDMGKVMKVLMPKLTGKADGKTIGDKVKEKLTS
ncbi:MAG TPA: glutamyl-tRNA amidotransferase [Syntrophaceae bacterium]|nr:glutamyl-tRNA amidotransferase [Syntrophaceae bacterium]